MGKIRGGICIKQNLISKILAMGIIVLFIGLGFSSAISIENRSSIVNNKSEEDCGCQETSDSYLVKLDRMTSRLEVYIKILMLLSKNNLELIKIWEELTVKISALEDVNNDKPICDILENIYLVFKDRLFYLSDIYKSLVGEEPLKAFLLTLLALPFAEFWLMIWVIGHELNCWDEPF